MKILHGYNKDHRPDCKRIVFGLNVTGDGHVPPSYALYDGNRADVTTHIPNREQLRAMPGREDFIHVADSKLCSYENLCTIAENGGRFITVVPRNFREVKDFLAGVRAGEDVEWQYEVPVPDSREKGATQDYRIHVGEDMGAGFRIPWIRSKAEERLEGSNRERRIAKAEQALTKRSSALNQRCLETREQIEPAIKKAVQGASAYLGATIHEDGTSERARVGRGRPGPNTRYEEKENVGYRLEWKRHEDEIARARRGDGLFPSVDNTSLEPIEVLRTYKDRPYLEKRFSTKKSVLEVAPVFPERPQRIEAMMFLHFVALMLVSLIERGIRLEMQERKIDKPPMRPAGMYTKKPTWRIIADSFDGVHPAALVQSGKVVQAALKGMSALRQRIPELLKVPIETYARLRDGWWRFAIA